MSFQKAIIIPYDVYTDCVRKSKKEAENNILRDPSLSSDKKLKLYQQERLQHKIAKTDKVDHDAPPSRDASEFILSNFPSKSQPIINSILDWIHKHPAVISFDDKLRVTVNGDLMPDSNIINILLYLSGNLPVTGSEDVPTGSEIVHRTLVHNGVPGNWFKVRIPARKRVHIEEDSDSVPSATAWTSFGGRPDLRSTRRGSKKR